MTCRSSTVLILPPSQIDDVRFRSSINDSQRVNRVYNFHIRHCKLEMLHAPQLLEIDLEGGYVGLKSLRTMVSMVSDNFAEHTT